MGPISDILENMIAESRGLFDFQAYMRDLKKNGVKKDEVYRILETLRPKFASNEEKEDLILEVMDIVTGFCSGHMKVWD